MHKGWPLLHLKAGVDGVSILDQFDGAHILLFSRFDNDLCIQSWDVSFCQASLHLHGCNIIRA